MWTEVEIQAQKDEAINRALAYILQDYCKEHPYTCLRLSKTIENYVNPQC